jgi:hypothetical protein
VIILGVILLVIGLVAKRAAPVLPWRRAHES